MERTLSIERVHCDMSQLYSVLISKTPTDVEHCLHTYIHINLLFLALYNITKLTQEKTKVTIILKINFFLSYYSHLHYLIIHAPL